MHIRSLLINWTLTIIKQYQMKKILVIFSISFKSLMNLIETFNINCFLYSLFHILMTKTNYDQSENLKRCEKKIEKSSVNAIAAFDHKYMKYIFTVGVKSVPLRHFKLGNFSIVFDNYVGGMLDLAKNDCAPSL